jgi:hypothetical protein
MFFQLNLLCSGGKHMQSELISAEQAAEFLGVNVGP